MAIKRRKLAPKAALKKPAPKAALKRPAPKASLPVGGPAVPAVAVALSDTRKCVHSRAYKKAAAKAKAEGLSKLETSKAACKAGQEAAEKWDLDHA